MLNAPSVVRSTELMVRSMPQSSVGGWCMVRYVNSCGTMSSYETSVLRWRGAASSWVLTQQYIDYLFSCDTLSYCVVGVLRRTGNGIP